MMFRLFKLPLVALFGVFLLSGCENFDFSAFQGKPIYTATTAMPIQVPPSEGEDQYESAHQQEAVDYIVVQKRDWLLSLWKDGRVLKTYPIMAMGANPVGQKVYEGDERTPEGQYFISDKHVSQNFQKFLGISYPNNQDKMLAQRFGLPPGGDVGIHGEHEGAKGRALRSNRYWTDGCLALKNRDVEEIYSLVGVGTPILIKP